jgi:hypothetical protein
MAHSRRRITSNNNNINGDVNQNHQSSPTNGKYKQSIIIQLLFKSWQNYANECQTVFVVLKLFQFKTKFV